MSLPLERDFAPMEAKLVDSLPTTEGWQFEPKWDGFRGLVFRDGDDIEIMSKAGKPLGRYFPDVVATMRAIAAERFVLDGEIVVPDGSALSFDELLQRIHPAASRVERLARERPAVFVAFDLLVGADGRALVGRPFTERRAALEQFVAEQVPDALSDGFWLSPSTTSTETVTQWMRAIGGGLDGIIAKRSDEPYRGGERAMQKMKLMRTAECVVGGFRYASSTRTGKIVGSLLLGLYDEDALLHHVGFCSSLTATQRASLTPELEALRAEPGFTGRAPGGPSRWSTDRSAEWEPLAPTLVVEVKYDHFSGGRFRHGASFLRWRPDKAPATCTLDQVTRATRSAAALITDDA